MERTVFIEAFIARLIPFYPEVTLPALRNFNPAEYAPVAVIATFGALLAAALLYGIGVWLRRLPKKSSGDVQQQRIRAIEKTAKEWLPWLLVLAPTPVGGILVIASGFFGIRPWMAALGVLVGEVLWRLSPVV